MNNLLADELNGDHDFDLGVRIAKRRIKNGDQSSDTPPWKTYEDVGEKTSASVRRRLIGFFSVFPRPDKPKSRGSDQIDPPYINDTVDIMRTWRGGRYLPNSAWGSTIDTE